MIYPNDQQEFDRDFREWELRVDLDAALERVRRVQHDHESMQRVYMDQADELIRTGRDDGFYNLTCGLYDDDVKLLATAYVCEKTHNGVPGTRIVR